MSTTTNMKQEVKKPAVLNTARDHKEPQLVIGNLSRNRSAAKVHQFFRLVCPIITPSFDEIGSLLSSVILLTDKVRATVYLIGTVVQLRPKCVTGSALSCS